MAESKSGDKEVLERARKRFAYVADYDDSNRRSQKTDTEFVYKPGASWPDKVREQRKAAGDPCMEFNQLRQFVNQVVNDQRQNRPGIRIHAANGEASEEVAETLQGLIRGIEYDSDAEAVYDSGYQDAVVGGRGYWRVVSEYEGQDSFNQKLVIKGIPDPLSVYLDPDYQDPDGGDRMYGFVVEAVPRDEFKQRFPDAKPCDYEAIEDIWLPDEDHVFIADYYERVAVKRTLVMLPDGTTAFKDELPPAPPGVEMQERAVDAYRIDWYKVAGGEQILEKHEWPGEIIPIVCTMGGVAIVDGKRAFEGLVAPAKDAAALFNFGMTQQAITLSLTPRSPWVASKTSIEGYEKLWADANQANLSVLPYHAYDSEGRQLPTPQRQMASQPDSGWLNWTQQMTGLMRSTIGMYENSLGQKGQETSGRAILAREKQGDNSTFHFQDNHSRAIALTGRIAVGCIPTYYDTQRIVQLVGADDTRQTVAINEQVPNPDNPLEAIAKNDVTRGKYAVTVEAGPSYATKRQETADLLMGMVSAYPPLMQIAGDLVIKAQDVPDADLIAERIKATLPPPILQMIQQKEAEKGGQKPLPPEVQAQMAQMDQQMQQAQQMLQQLQAENQQLKSGEMSKAAEMQARQDADARKAEASSMTDQAKAMADAAKAQADAEKAAADNETRRFDTLMRSATDIVKEAMKVPEVVPGEQAARVDIGADAMAPVAGDDAGTIKELAQAMLAMAQQAQAQAAAAALPRQIVLQRGPDGRVAGGTIATQEPEPVEAPPDPVITALAGISEAMAKMMAPKRVIYDDDGRPVGVEAVQ